MNEKLKFYADNESKLLNSVKATIFKTFEKTEKLKEGFKKQLSDLENKVETLQNSKKELKQEKNNSEDELNKKLKNDAEKLKQKKG